MTQRSVDEAIGTGSLIPEARLPVSLVVLATLVWGWPFLAPQSLFWDDWLQLAGDPLQIYTDLGFFWVGHAIDALMLAGPWAVKSVALLATIATTLGVFAISARGLGLTIRDRWLLGAITVVLPLNLAHGSVGVLALYTTCLGLFVVAWWILVVGPEASPPPHWRAIIAALFFFTSFTTASLLVFVAVPAIHFCALYRDRDQPFWRSVLGLLWRYWYLPAAPVLFWVLRAVWFTPSVTYASYNELHIPTDLRSPLGAGLVICAFALIVAVVGLASATTGRRLLGIEPQRVALAIAGAMSALWAAYTTWTIGSLGAAGLLVIGTLAAAALVLVARALRRAPAPRAHTSLALIGVGLVAVAYVPYLLVEKQATFENWESRHQLLLPFGIAAISVAALGLLSETQRRRPVTLIAGFLVAAMAVAAAAAPIALALDWRKQEQIIVLLSQNPEVAAARTVEFTDLTTTWNWDDRQYRFYEYTALLRAAHGGQSRFGGDAEDTQLALTGRLHPIQVNPPMYGVADWQDSGTMLRVTIVPREGASGIGLFFGEPSLTLRVEPAR